MIAVQAAGCAPIVRAFEAGQQEVEGWSNARTVAAGLRVPQPLGGTLVLRALRESNGTAVAVDDEDMLDDALLLARTEGLFAAPESGACVTAIRMLLSSGFLQPHERIVLLSTGSGLKYIEAFDTRLAFPKSSEYEKLGGLITPR
jgi:threonine synthase